MRSPRLAAAVVVAILASPGLCAAQVAGRMLVMPFENVTRDGRIVWLGEAASVLLADNLNAIGGQAITREERREAFARLQIPHTASLTDATVIRIGQIVGASHVVVGTLQLEGESLVVHARAIALEAARVESRVTDRGTVLDLFAIFERVARGVMLEGSPDGRKLGYSSVAAFENYIKGLIAETPATALSYLNASLRAQPTFDRARLAVWDVHTEQGDHAQALAAASRVPAASETFRRARFLVGLSQLALDRHDEAFQTFKTLAEARATAAVLNNAGVALLRRGGSPQTGTPAYYFGKAAEADATEPDYFFNLGYAYWIDRDMVAAAYWLRETVRRAPADGDAHYVLGVALTGAGSSAEATREKELARRLSSTYSEWEERLGPDTIPKGLERVKGDVELPRAARLEEVIASASQRDQRELARFYLERGLRLYRQEHDREALTELNRALFLSPYEADAHLLAGRIYLREGRVREAIGALKISLWSAETADAHALLATAYAEVRDFDAARAEAERSLALDPASTARRVLEALPPR